MKYYLFVFLLVPTLIFAQSSVGVTMGLHTAQYFVNYSKVLDIPSCCPQYSNPLSNSFSIGVFHSLLMNQQLALVSNVQFSSLTASTTSKAIYPVLINNTVQSGEFLYTSEFTFNQIEFSSGIEFAFNEHISLGTRFGVVVEYSTTYSQKEEITTQGIDYKNPDFESVTNRKIDNALLKPTAIIFAQYKVPLWKKSLFFTRVDIGSIFANGPIPINNSSLHTRLLLGIEIPLFTKIETNPLDPQK